MKPTKLKLDTHMNKRLIYCVHQMQLSSQNILVPLFFFFFLSLQLAKIKNLHLQNCFNLPLMATDGVYELCSLCYISFFFLSNFQTLKFFVTLFSGTVRSRRMKFVTHMENGWMYRVYRNASAALICPFIFFIFLSLLFSNIKIFITLFSGTVRPKRLKLSTHMDSGQMYGVYRNQAAAAHSSLHFFIFLSLQFSNIEIFRHFSQEL